ncbi:response regulator [bacterium]|nr:response regulator [bacterium]
MDSCTVLVVDDSKFMRTVVADLLAKANCEVVEASNGAYAVQMYEECQPDLVLLDILMPEQDGIETLRQILDLDSDARVVMVTSLGMGMQDYLEQALDLGAVGYITKTAIESQLSGVLETVLGVQMPNEESN